MSLKEKERIHGDKAKAPVHASPLQTETAKPAETKSIPKTFCTHGIHSGSFEIAGKTYKQARDELAGALNLPKEAVIVANGDVVQDENEIISEDMTMLNFVKKASVKGRVPVDGYVIRRLIYRHPLYIEFLMRFATLRGIKVPAL